MSHLKETLNLRWHHFLVTSLSKTRLQSYIKRWWFGSEVWKTKKTLDQNIFTTFKLPENIRIWPCNDWTDQNEWTKLNFTCELLRFFENFRVKAFEKWLHFYRGSNIRWVKQKFGETFNEFSFINPRRIPSEHIWHIAKSLSCSEASFVNELPTHFPYDVFPPT